MLWDGSTRSTFSCVLVIWDASACQKCRPVLVSEGEFFGHKAAAMHHIMHWNSVPRGTPASSIILSRSGSATGISASSTQVSLRMLAGRGVRGAFWKVACSLITRSRSDNKSWVKHRMLCYECIWPHCRPEMNAGKQHNISTVSQSAIPTRHYSTETATCYCDGRH
jgi:hypothetical protein